VVVNYFNIPGIAVTPFKADAPSVVNANAVLPDPVANQCLQMVGGRDAQVLQSSGNFKLVKFAERSPLTGCESFHSAMTEKRLCIFATKRLYHACILSLRVSIVKEIATHWGKE
jgi:hypothetical protein